MSFFFKRADGTENKVSGYKFSKQKLGSAKVAASKYNSSELPQRIDLRSYMTGVENQGGLNSCAANAVAGAYEYLVKRHKGIDYDVSRLFIYYNGRSIGGGEVQDQGSYIADVVGSLKEYGACSESTYPYQNNLVNEEPTEDAYEEAASFLVESVELVDNKLQAWKSVLAEGHPIIFGLLLYNSFDSHRKKGLVPVPSDSELSRDSHSGHAMLCVGYSDPDQVFIVRNSWGQGWGDSGYCYIPYRYMMNEKFNMGDSWIIKRLDNFEDNKEEYWSDEEESILESIESEIANMSEDDYHAMCETMGDFPLEQRLALILLWAAGSDEELSDEEYDEISNYLKTILEYIGIESNVKKLLQNTAEYVGDEDLLNESVELLNEYLSKKVLTQTIIDVENIIGVDEYSSEEEDFVNYLIESWQIEDEHFQEIQNQSEEETEEEEEEYDEEESEEEESDEEEESESGEEEYFEEEEEESESDEEYEDDDEDDEAYYNEEE